MKGVDETEQAATCANICAQLEAAGVRVKLDDRVNYNPGWKYNYWELKGVPLRLELGPKDLDKRQVCMAWRKGAPTWARIAHPHPHPITCPKNAPRFHLRPHNTALHSTSALQDLI